jgi:hypothetical protein
MIRENQSKVLIVALKRASQPSKAALRLLQVATLLPLSGVS